MKNKALMMLLSLIIAFGLWLYVVNFISKESDETFNNIPVVFIGERVLVEDRGLMITSGRNATVSLQVKGNRSDLLKLNSSNIVVEVDLTRIYEASDQAQNLTYDIRFPGDVPDSAVSVESRNPDTISLMVEEKIYKNVLVEIDDGGTNAPDGYIADKEEAVLSSGNDQISTVQISGPKSIMDQIEKAVIRVDLSERTESISETFRYTLCNAQNEPVDLKELVTANIGEIRLDMKIQRVKEIPLVLTVVDGGGATQKTTSIEIEPRSIKVSGSDQVLEKLTEIELGTIELGEILGDTTLTFPIALPDNVTNIPGVTEATVKVSFPDLRKKDLKIRNFQAINVPEGLEHEILTQELTVTVRGPAALVQKMTENDVTVTVDFSTMAIGTATVKAKVTIAEGYAGVGELGNYSVSVTLREVVEETT